MDFVTFIAPCFMCHGYSTKSKPLSSLQLPQCLKCAAPPQEISTGNMYGDGRAISVGEVLIGERWELQLKGTDLGESEPRAT